MRIYMHHIRQAKMCAKGTRMFFERHNFDFQDFLKNGIEAELFIATGDAMALQVVEVAKNGRK
ncbi:hypothetical protein EJP75_08315 [Acinetobacter baumannii]|nr:hypothetical protein EJP75_08315 [Acinetobacter baumannii]